MRLSAVCFFVSPLHSCPSRPAEVNCQAVFFSSMFNLKQQSADTNLSGKISLKHMRVQYVFIASVILTAFLTAEGCRGVYHCSTS